MASRALNRIKDFNHSPSCSRRGEECERIMTSTVNVLGEIVKGLIGSLNM